MTSSSFSSRSSSSSPSSPARRRWLKQSTTLAGSLGLGGVAGLLGAQDALAQASGYRALVCIFLYGGNDGVNTVVPTDARYAAYSAVRGNLAIPRASLLPIGNSAFGLHPAMSALASLANAGRVAPVLNVGPLVTPLTKAQYRGLANGADALPDSLFSHSDQQVLWETSSGDANERTGWGGRAMGALGAGTPVISVGGTARFGSSSSVQPLVLPGPGTNFGAQGLLPSDMTWAPRAARKAALDVLYAQAPETTLGGTYAKLQADAFSVSQRLAGLVKVLPGSEGSSAAIDAAFAPLTQDRTDGQTSYKVVTTSLGQQLYQIAKLIAGNTTVGGNRHIYFAQMNGFDTHAGQVLQGNPVGGTHAALLKELGDAMACFQNAMNAVYLANAVTTFTQSDFGRTLKPNNSLGTDHAWGNHHLVMGGAVHSGAHGVFPDLTLGGPDDIGQADWERQGRWIPTTSVDQYAATLLGWFGASDSQLGSILPNLRNFSTPKLSFL
jgi:uncharacterized protein (DUF1501 family)